MGRQHLDLVSNESTLAFRNLDSLCTPSALDNLNPISSLPLVFALHSIRLPVCMLSLGRNHQGSNPVHKMCFESESIHPVELLAERMADNIARLIMLNLNVHSDLT